MISPDAQQLPRRLTELLRDRYTFVSILGKGGSGTVYEVRNQQLGRLEALKVLTNTMSPETTKRFVQEARVSASLDHPGIVKVYDFGQFEGINWFSMQIIDGPSLSAIIESGIRLDAVGFSRLAIPLLDALSYSHKHGIIHRDIKPGNILIHTGGYPCLTDFGIAKSQDAADLTQTGNMLGTPAYMAPEQAEGKQVDSRADQYSLAITLYRAVTGRLPFSSTGTLETLVQRLKEEPEPIDWHRPDFPASLKVILMKALSRDRNDRYPSVEDMKNALVSACEADNIQWNRPLENFDHVPSLAKSHAEGRDTASLDRISLSPRTRSRSVVGRHSDRSFLPVVIGSLAVVAVLTSLLLYRKYAARQALEGVGPSRQGNEQTEKSHPTNALYSIREPNKETPPPTPKDERNSNEKQQSDRPAPSATIPRQAVKPPMLLENHAPVSVPIPQELVGKNIQIRVKIDEAGKVQECTILSKDVTPDARRIATAVALNMLFSPALAEDGKPVASETAVSITL